MRIRDWSSDVCSSDLWTGNTGLAASIFGVPRWRTDAVVTYAQPTYSLTAHMSYVPKGLLNPNWIGPEQDGYSPYLPNSVNYNHVSSRFYLDLSARVKVFGGEDNKVELFGGIRNVLDKDRSTEHTSVLQSLMRISYAVFCLPKKN